MMVVSFSESELYYTGRTMSAFEISPEVSTL
jgi:hypothetical protein